MTSDLSHERVHYLDHLRALAMLAGVLFHAALAYSPLMSGYFPTADRQNSPWVDAVVWGSHLVRMPLFFLITGFFAAWLLERRGAGGLFRQRMRRIALPLVVSWPLVHWALSASTVWAARSVENPSAVLALVRHFTELPDPPPAPLTLAHLWFLYYVLLFTVLHWAFRTLGLARYGERAVRGGAAWVLLALPLSLAPALTTVSAPHPAPESPLPQFWAIAFYGAFYALGAFVHGAPDWLARARALAPGLTVGCGVLYSAFLWRLNAEPPGAAHPSASWTVALLEAFLSVWLTVLCLLAGQRLLQRPSATLQYLARSSYWVYLLHLPILFALQYALMDFELAWPAKLGLAGAGTLALCLLSHHLLVARTPLRRFVG
ncbi:MAG: acyltransferase family protein [Planctomycetes bacterium]|nr:acyltransferase family protein [Planctomycetota bacterium]